MNYGIHHRPLCFVSFLFSHPLMKSHISQKRAISIYMQMTSTSIFIPTSKWKLSTCRPPSTRLKVSYNKTSHSDVSQLGVTILKLHITMQIVFNNTFTQLCKFFSLRCILGLFKDELTCKAHSLNILNAVLLVLTSSPHHQQCYLSLCITVTWLLINDTGSCEVCMEHVHLCTHAPYTLHSSATDKKT